MAEKSHRFLSSYRDDIRCEIELFSGRWTSYQMNNDQNLCEDASVSEGTLWW